MTVNGITKVASLFPRHFLPHSMLAGWPFDWLDNLGHRESAGKRRDRGDEFEFAVGGSGEIHERGL